MAAPQFNFWAMGKPGPPQRRPLRASSFRRSFENAVPLSHLREPGGFTACEPQFRCVTGTARFSLRVPCGSGWPRLESMGPAVTQCVSELVRAHGFELNADG